MMSNCAFWSASGELLAVHGDQGAVPPRASFGPWAAALRLPPGRLVDLGPHFPVPEAPGPGWCLLEPERFPPSRRPRACDPAAPVAVFAPVFDAPAPIPATFHHEKFTWRSWPTWVSTCRPTDTGAEGWYAALDAEKQNQFLVRLVPHHGRLPGEGWRNMLGATLRSVGLRLVPLNGLPSPQVLEALPAWDYRAEAGRGAEAAAWDLQLLPSRRWLQGLSGLADPWQATALVRWVRPGAPSPDHGFDPGREGRWSDLFGRLPVADARKLVQNVLTTAQGGVASAAVLFYDSVVVPGPEGRTLVRHVPQEGLPLSLLSTLFGRRAWHEVERARRQIPDADQRRIARLEAFDDLDRWLAEGRLEWSASGLVLWEALYRRPRARALEAELATYRASDRWSRLLTGDPRLAETLLRRLDVTDAALCLRDAPDTRWRRFVTARREAELVAEAAFCRDWEARGELTLERQIDAWRSWDALVDEFPLTERGGGN